MLTHILICETTLFFDVVWTMLQLVSQGSWSAETKEFLSPTVASCCYCKYFFTAILGYFLMAVMIMMVAPVVMGSAGSSAPVNNNVLVIIMVLGFIH